MNNTYNTYLNNFSQAWELEKNNESPLNTLKAMYKIYLFKQLATDSAIKKTEVNKFFIREVFKIQGDIKKSPFKSCIYNKLTCLNYLIGKTNFLTLPKLDVDAVIDSITEKTFKKYSNFYDVLKEANKNKKQVTKKDSTDGINDETSGGAGVVNITNTTAPIQEKNVDSMQLLDDLMSTTLSHFELCFIDNPAESLKKLIDFSESINKLVNKASYNAKKAA